MFSVSLTLYLDYATKVAIGQEKNANKVALRSETSYKGDMGGKLLEEIQNQTQLSRADLARRLRITRQAVEKMLHGGDCRAETLTRMWRIARDECKWSAKRFLERLEADFPEE